MLYNLLMPVQIQKIFYILLAVLVLMVMITVHEFGHYIVGKIFKFQINEFSIGMGPAIYKKKKKNGEIFSIRLLPLGGYCAFEGEDEEGATDNCFNKKKPWQRILVLIAGALMNYLLALVVIMITFGVYGQSLTGAKFYTPSVRYSTEQGLENGDLIVSITADGKKTGIYLTTDLLTALNGTKAGEKVSLEVIDKDGNLQNREIVLQHDTETDSMLEVAETYKALGVASVMQVFAKDGNRLTARDGDFIRNVFIGDDYDIDKVDELNFISSPKTFLSELEGTKKGDNIIVFLSRGDRTEISAVKIILDDEWDKIDKTDQDEVLDYFGVSYNGSYFYLIGDYHKFGFFKSLGHSFAYSVKIGGVVLRSLGELITGKIGLNAMGGTITTISQTSEIISYGFSYLLEIMAFIGVNLAVFNLLPIPALDGSRVLFCIIEWVRGKPVNRKVEAVIHAVGFVFILGFAILVDLLHFI